VIPNSLRGRQLDIPLLIPDPQALLFTLESPAPAVATWKAIAETLGAGLGPNSTSAFAAFLVEDSPD
jgi:hypothetical protein